MLTMPLGFSDFLEYLEQSSQGKKVSLNERIKDRKVHKSCPQAAAISKTSGVRSSKPISNALDQSTVTTDHDILSPGRIRILSGGPCVVPWEWVLQRRWWRQLWKWKCSKALTLPQQLSDCQVLTISHSSKMGMVTPTSKTWGRTQLMLANVLIFILSRGSL